MASNNFINECKNRANGNRLGKIIVDGVQTPITNSDNLKSFSIDSGCYVDGNIIGSVYVKKLTGEFLALPDGVDLIDKSIDAQIGVKYADSTTEYIDVGKYKVERPINEKTANKCKITAYDYLIDKLDSKYVCGIDYSTPKTLSDLYIDECNQLGLIPVTTTFLNSDIPITGNPFTNGEKNRLVLQTIAKIACSFVTVDNDNNKIDLSWLSNSTEPDYTFELNDYATLEGGIIEYGPVNSVTIKNSDIDDENVTQTDAESIAQFGEHSLVISEDYILYNAQLRQQAMTAIFNRLDGLKYVDATLITYYGKPFLKIGDKIRIYITSDSYIDTYVLNHIFTYDGTFYSKISSPALTEQEIKTKQNASLGEILSRTQIEVNKQGKIITSTVSDVSNISNDNLNIHQKLSNDDEDLRQYKEAISTQFEQVRDSFNFKFTNEILPMITNGDSISQDKLNIIERYIRFVSGNIILGASDSNFSIKITNEKISFFQGENNEIAYFSNNELYIRRAIVAERLLVKTWGFEEDSAGNLNIG